MLTYVASKGEKINIEFNVLAVKTSLILIFIGTVKVMTSGKIKRCKIMASVFLVDREYYSIIFKGNKKHQQISLLFLGKTESMKNIIKII